MGASNIGRKAKIGILISGHKEYWSQFAGVRERIMQGAKAFEKIVRRSNVDIISTDMIDTIESSFEVGKMFKKADIDLIFVYLHTYVASGRWIQAILDLKVPIVVVSMVENIDFDDEDIQIIDVLLKGSPCQLPEACSALLRVGREAVDVIFGCIGKEGRAQKRIGEWCDVAKILRTYKDCIIGYLGHSYDGMLDINSDATMFTRTFHIYIKMLEMCELVDYVEKTTDMEVSQKISEIKKVFDFMDASYDPTTKNIIQEDVDWAARCAVGLDKLVANNRLSGLAYYYAGLNNIYERVASNLIIGNTLLTSKGISLAGEADIRTCIAMKTTSAIGAGGSFAEFAIVDFEKDLVFVGHDGPHDLMISNNRPVIRGLGTYHGKRGQGISVEYSIKSGDMTMVSLCSDVHGRFRFQVAQGQSMEGKTPQIGNTLTRGYFGEDVAEFIEEWSIAGPPHHMSLCVGHIGSIIKKLGKALDVEVDIIRQSK